MKLPSLLDKLYSYNPHLYGNKENDFNLETVRLFSKGQTFFDSSILYLSDSCILPNENQRGNFTLICHGKAQDFDKYKNSSFTLIYLDNVDSYQDLFNNVQEVLSKSNELNNKINIMTNSLLENKGLQYLVDSCSKILEVPVFVVDLQHKYLAISYDGYEDNEFVKEELQSGYISENGVKLINKYKLDENISKNNKPYYFDNPIYKKRMLINSITIQSIEIGHVMILESKRKFDSIDSELLNHFAKLLGIELQKNNIFTNNKGVMYSYILADLLKNPSINTNSIIKRLNILGYKIKENFYILSIPLLDYNLSDTNLEVIINQIRNILIGSIYVIYEGYLIFLITREKYKGFSDYELEQLTYFLDSNNLKAGISNFFNKLGDISKFHKQAVQATQMGMKLQDPSPIYYYSDYYLYQMLDVCEQNNLHINLLIHPGLMQLYFYDQDKDTDLVTTLKEYLLYPSQPSKIAENLHIHKNTLLYRMSKIKSITNCNFEFGQDLMSFALSFKIMEYLDMI